MPGNQPLGNDVAQVERDAQISEVNRALTAIRITRPYEFALIAQGLEAILNKQALPTNITDREMIEGLNNIRDFFAEQCQWVRDPANKQAFYNLATEIIKERITLYTRLAHNDRQEAARRYILQEETRRRLAQENQALAQAAQPPVGDARTLGLSETDFLIYQIQNPGTNTLNLVHRLSPGSRAMFAINALLAVLLIMAAYLLTLLFATWIGGSILADAGWKGVFTAHQLVNFSMSVAGTYALIDVAWYFCTDFRRPPETRGEFLGYKGTKATALKYGLFFIAASLLQPLMMGVMNGAVYGFSLAAVSIGLPLAMLGFAVAAYFIVINTTALFGMPALAIEARNVMREDGAYEAVNDFPAEDLPALPAHQPAIPDSPSSSATESPVLLSAAPITRDANAKEDNPLTITELREARIRHLDKTIKPAGQRASAAGSSTGQTPSLGRLPQ